MDRKLIDYLPPIIGEIKEIKLLMEAMQEEVVQLWLSTEDTRKEAFFDTHTTYGISRWEKILEIRPKGSDSLEERSYRILARLNERLPYTIRMLYEQLNGICGKENYIIQTDFDSYYIRVSVYSEEKAALFAVEDLLERVLPLNLLVDMALRVKDKKPGRVFIGGFAHETVKVVAYPETTEVFVKKEEKYYLAASVVEEIFIHAYPE